MTLSIFTITCCWHLVVYDSRWLLKAKKLYSVDTVKALEPIEIMNMSHFTLLRQRQATGTVKKTLESSLSLYNPLTTLTCGSADNNRFNAETTLQASGVLF